MDIVALTCSRYEVTEWNQTAEARDDGEEYQWTPHHERNLLWLATVLWIQLIVALSPEDDVVETEHVECSHTGNHGHEPAHEWRELEAC